MVRDGEGTPLPLDQTNRLVVSGPYYYVRNPMAIAGIGQGLSVALIFQSLPVGIYSLLGGGDLALCGSAYRRARYAEPIRSTISRISADRAMLDTST